MHLPRLPRTLLLSALAGAALTASAAPGQAAHSQTGQPAATQAEPQEPPAAAPSSIPPGSEEPPPPSPEELSRQRPIVFQLRARSELALNADLRDDPGDVTVIRLGTGLGVAIPIRQFGRLDVGFDYEYSNYAFDNATGFAPGVDSPWEHIHHETLSLRYSQQYSPRLGWYVGGSLGLFHEDGADLGDSLVGAGLGGVRYALTEDIMVGSGAVVVTRLENNPLVIPLLTIDWTINDQVRLSNGGRLGLMLGYEASQTLTLSVGAHLERREFRLSDTGPVPDGIGRDLYIPLVAGLAYRPTPRLSIELAGGAYLNQTLRLLDSDGDTIVKSDVKPTPFGSLLVSFRF